MYPIQCNGYIETETFVSVELILPLLHAYFVL